MAIIEFKFKASENIDERTDILLCANRWKLYRAIHEVDDLIRKLYSGKTYQEKYLYPAIVRRRHPPAVRDDRNGRGIASHRRRIEGQAQILTQASTKSKYKYKTPDGVCYYTTWRMRFGRCFNIIQV